MVKRGDDGTSSSVVVDPFEVGANLSIESSMGLDKVAVMESVDLLKSSSSSESESAFASGNRYKILSLLILRSAAVAGVNPSFTRSAKDMLDRHSAQTFGQPVGKYQVERLISSHGILSLREDSLLN